jgi:hypothetical protein
MHLAMVRVDFDTGDTELTIFSDGQMLYDSEYSDFTGQKPINCHGCIYLVLALVRCCIFAPFLLLLVDYPF